MKRTCLIGGCFETAVSGTNYCAECTSTRKKNGLGPLDPARATVRVQARDFATSPYSQPEERVVEYLREIMPSVGAGDDPVGFLMSSHLYQITMMRVFEALDIATIENKYTLDEIGKNASEIAIDIVTYVKELENCNDIAPFVEMWLEKRRAHGDLSAIETLEHELGLGERFCCEIDSKGDLQPYCGRIRRWSGHDRAYAGFQHEYRRELQHRRPGRA